MQLRFISSVNSVSDHPIGHANSSLLVNAGLGESQAVGNLGNFCVLAEVLLSFVFVFTFLSRCSAQLHLDAL